MQKEPVLAVGYLIIVMLCVVRVVTSRRIKMPLIMVAILSILSIISVHIILSVLVASGAPAGEHRDEVTMNMKGTNMSYYPAVLKVTKGTKVTFKNSDALNIHTVTSGDGRDDPNAGKIFDKKMISPGQAVDIIFNMPGEFKYFCTIHPWMHGLIIVK